ncbi:MAG: class I SAM-dependent methyltransferase [Flavobacteriales bacterium]
MENFSSHFQKNLKSWEDRTPIHLCSNFYNNELFIKTKNSLNTIELNALEDINQKSLLHLQCHFGQDTLSLANLGANVTGVDFSPSAIAAAKQLAIDTKLNATFVESNVLELDLNEEYDIIFSSYGALGWLPDLQKWGKVVAKHLKKGGTFLLVEFHPLIDLLDIETQYGYFFDKNTEIEKEEGSYTDGGKDMKTEYYWWSHSLTEIFKGLESNGLKLQLFEEFDYSPYHLDGMIEREPNKYVLEKRANQSLPYVYALKATKK